MMSEKDPRLDDATERFELVREPIVDMAVALSANMLIYVDMGFETDCVLRMGHEADEALEARLAAAARHIRRG